MIIFRKKSCYHLLNIISILGKNSTVCQKNQSLLFHCSRCLNGPGQEIKMPSLSPTMSEGKIIKWLKKVGDVINPGDVLCDIETDKAVVSMEVEDEGILAKIVIPENVGNVKVGSIIALMVAEGEDWKNVESPSNDSNVESATDNSTSDKESPPIVIKMPSLSPTMTSGVIVKWMKEEGSSISPGDVLCEIQTDKAVMSLETEEEGILAKILVSDDSKEVEVGTIIALMVSEGEDWRNVKMPVSSDQKSVPSEKKTVSQLSSPKSGAYEISDSRGKTYGPAVKALLSVYQLEPGLIKPSGRHNMLLKEDVLKYIKDNDLKKKPPKVEVLPTPKAQLPSSESPVSTSKTSNFVDVELSNMRKTIATRLVQSKTEIPHCYSSAKFNLNNVINLKNVLQREGIKLSFNDFVTKSIAVALQLYPKANALCTNNRVTLVNDIDISIAVATDNGLYTPIVKSANSKNLLEISRETRELAAKARQGKLKPEEYLGGSFTISNLGMYGIKHFSAIINPPQVAILAVGSTQEVFDSDFNIVKQAVFNLSYDRRALEEQEAAEFMETLKNILDNPNLLLHGFKNYSKKGL